MIEGLCRAEDDRVHSQEMARQVLERVTGAQVRAEDACMRCGYILTPGDWPWCRGSQSDHQHPYYGWGWGRGGPYTERSHPSHP